MRYWFINLPWKRITFNPSATFVPYLWNSIFLWILPDSPSGISILFCPETKSLNSFELKKERPFEWSWEIIQKKLFIPTNVMELLLVIQNLLAIISLCFGPSSHSARFLKSWTTHIYENRIMHSSLHTTDHTFFAKILSALIAHCKLTGNSVMMLMTDHQ